MWHQNSNNQLVEPGDRAFWMGLWKSGEFKALLDNPATGYQAALDEVIKRPWWMIQSEHDYERRHFSVWFGQAIVRRQYDNPVIEDLYYWHDLLHGLTFADASRMDIAQWKRAMRANEIAVSMETEILIYWRAPALREVSFNHPIWHDHMVNGLRPEDRLRLTQYRARMQREAGSEDCAREADLLASLPHHWPLPYDFDQTLVRPSFRGLWDLRRAISLSPDPENHVEMELARYEGQAEPFYEGWASAWGAVEQERAIFANLCAQGQWKKAVARRSGIWERVADENGVPYGALAKALASG